jgi:hypothetical protein
MTACYTNIDRYSKTLTELTKLYTIVDKSVNNFLPDLINIYEYHLG